MVTHHDGEFTTFEMAEIPADLDALESVND